MKSEGSFGSKDLGLVLLHQIFQVDDLHYGMWDNDIPRKIANVSMAQSRFTDFLLSHLPDPGIDTGGPCKTILDVGCGTGKIMSILKKRGYAVQGVVPSEYLAECVHNRFASDPDVKVYVLPFEAFPVEEHAAQYDIVLFSESFQYIPIDQALAQAARILKPAGTLIVCDFFKSLRHGDGGPGDRTMGGGHRLSKFYAQVAASRFSIERDVDITTRVSPSIEVLNEVLMQRVKPALGTIDHFMQHQHPVIRWFVKMLFRRQIKTIRAKYFAGNRSRETFERYKSYRLLALKLRDPNEGR